MAAAVRWSVITLVCFFLAEAGLFRSGLYRGYLQPDSSAGDVANRLYHLRHTAPGASPEVAIIGDSRVAEGFSAPLAGAATHDRLKFWNLGIPGLNPRVWYYLIRDADPDRNRFRAIILALDHYTDDDYAYAPFPDRVVDINYAAGLVRLTDCPGFAASFRDWADREQALAGCLFPGLPFRADLRELLRAPQARVRISRLAHSDGQKWLDGYTGIEHSMTGIEADFEHRVIRLPPGIGAAAMFSVDLTIMPDRLPYGGETARYRKWALGRIVDRYAGTGTKIIFIQLPRAPLAVPDGTAPEEFVPSVASKPGVEVVPEATFHHFEQPDLFADGLHLNATGRKAFSAELAGAIAARLGVN